MSDLILNLIAKYESDGYYNRIYGAGHQVKNLVEMTIDEVLEWQSKQRFSASGRYQIIRKTLIGLKKELKLTGKELFDEDMQDRMARVLLDRRGYQKFLDGKISINKMMINLSKEWASFPVPKRMKGHHRIVEKGETYYAGDGINKAHASVMEVRDTLEKERAKYTAKKKHKPSRGFKSLIYKLMFWRNYDV